MTTTEITWGDPIDAANDGKPLPWLKADEQVKCYWRFSGPREGMVTWVHCIHGWKEGFQIKLPADHAYYLATSRGFTYWPGGESAPDDWDGGHVLLRSRDDLCPDAGIVSWENHGYGSDIIGYRKRAATDDGYVRVKRMTWEEAGDLCRYTLNYLGVLKDETPLEQFERSHGGLDNNQRDIVEAFIEWQKNNG